MYCPGLRLYKEDDARCSLRLWLKTGISRQLNSAKEEFAKIQKVDEANPKRGL